MTHSGRAHERLVIEPHPPTFHDIYFADHAIFGQHQNEVYRAATQQRQECAPPNLAPMVVSNNDFKRQHICIHKNGREDNVVGVRAMPNETVSHLLERLHPGMKGPELQNMVKDTLKYNKDYDNELGDGSMAGNRMIYITSRTQRDAHNRPTIVESPDGKSTTFTYDKAGHLSGYNIADEQGQGLERVNKTADGRWTCMTAGSKPFQVQDVAVDGHGDITVTDENGNKFAHLTKGEDLFTHYVNGNPLMTRVYHTDVDSEGHVKQTTEAHYEYDRDGDKEKCNAIYADDPYHKYALDAQSSTDRHRAAEGRYQLDMSADSYVESSMQHQQLISKALQIAGLPATPQNLKDVELIVNHESSWNAGAVNSWDCNATAGDASKGLMQTTGSTFKQYACTGYDRDITDPLSNLVAGIRYAVSRYGNLDSVPGVKAVRSGHAYIGY